MAEVLPLYSKQYQKLWKERSNFMKELSKKYYGGKSIVANYMKLASVGHNMKLRSAARSVSLMRRAQLDRREARRLSMLHLRRIGLPWKVIHQITGI